MRSKHVSAEVVYLTADGDRLNRGHWEYFAELTSLATALSLPYATIIPLPCLNFNCKLTGLRLGAYENTPGNFVAQK